MRIRPNCEARTMMVDIRPIPEASQLTGLPIEACVFIGSSSIRQYAEEWRSSPAHLRILFAEAIESGARRTVSLRHPCRCDAGGSPEPGVLD